MESARRQLGTALALYLRDEDPVSVHCLAGGGCELIEYYAQKSGAKPFTSHMLEAVPDLTIKKIRRLQRQYWAAFKHAAHHSGEERKDDELLRQFTDIQNDDALFIGWFDYAQVVKALPIEAQVHQAWYIAMYPEKLDPRYSIDRYLKIFPKLKTHSRAGQKQMLNDVIRQSRIDSNLMDDDLTEKRCLILGW